MPDRYKVRMFESERPTMRAMLRTTWSLHFIWGEFPFMARVFNALPPTFNA
jgi:hypothetical protein